MDSQGLTQRPGLPTLLGVRYDASSSFVRGAADGPLAIREAISAPSSNPWTEAGADLGSRSALDDAGDLTPSSGDAGRASITARVSELLAAGRLPVVLGGDHSITYPVLRAIRAQYPRLTLLHFDAHADLYDRFDGDRYSHACPMARIMEEGLADRLIQVGIRTLSPDQRQQAERFDVDLREMRHWRGPEPIQLDDPVYLSLDLDVLDPAFITGIAHPEPGGLSVAELVAQLRELEARVVGVDLVELNPRLDPSGRSGLVAVKLLKSLVDLLRRSNQSREAS